MIAVDTVIFMIVNNMVTIFVAWVNNCFDSLVLVFHYTWVVHYMVSYFVHCSYAYPFIEDVDMRGSRQLSMAVCEQVLHYIAWSVMGDAWENGNMYYEEGAVHTPDSTTRNCKYHGAYGKACGIEHEGYVSAVVVYYKDAQAHYFIIPYCHFGTAIFSYFQTCLMVELQYSDLYQVLDLVSFYCSYFFGSNLHSLAHHPLNQN